MACYLARGDFRVLLQGLPRNSVDLILTDPPYSRKSVHLYRDLAFLGYRVLKPGGYLACYAGHFHLDRVMIHIGASGLHWFWAIKRKHHHRPLRYASIVTYGNLILLWQKPPRRRLDRSVPDLVEPPLKEKDYHPWQQPLSESELLIERLTDPGALIVEPFLGSGTVAVAAIRKQRHVIGIEINELVFDRAQRRIQRALAALRAEEEDELILVR